MSKLVSIIIPVYGNWNFTEACLRDLSKLSKDYEIIVVDNGDSPALHVDYDVVPNWMPRNLNVVFNGQNLGFAKACNQGYAEATGEYILFLNNDIRVKGGDSIKESWIADNLIAATGDDTIVSPNGGLLDNNFSFIKETDCFIDSDYFYLSGWCLFSKKSTFEKLSMNGQIFDEKFFAYFEDTDLSFRARQMGMKLKVVPVPVVHFGRMTGRKVGLSSLYVQSKGIFEGKWK